MAPRTVQRFTPPTAPAARPPIASAPRAARPGAPVGHRGGAPAGVVALLAGGAALGWSLLVAPAPAQAAPEADPPSEPDAAPTAPQGPSTPREAPDPLWSPTTEEHDTGPGAVRPGETTAPGQLAQPSGAPRHQPAGSPLAGRIAQDTLTVRAGESLWSLTEDLLGPTATPAQIAEQWPLLWEANADRIRDPDRVLAGTVLQLPRALLPEP